MSALQQLRAALAFVCFLLLLAVVGLVSAARTARRAVRRCEVPCATSLRIEATAPAVFTVSCGGGR
jgi:hypothetical protein